MKILQNYHPAQMFQSEHMPLVSVIVAAYNIENYIKRGVSSVLLQTYRNLEVIVVDDGSTDNTGVICDELAACDERLQVIHQSNEGPSKARNRGMAVAKGDFIGFVDGDDFIDETMYEVMVNALLENGADLAICRYRQVHKDHTEDASLDRAVVFEGMEALQAYVEEQKQFAIQNAVWNKLYRRELLTTIRFPEGKWYEDIMFATYVLGTSKKSVYLDTAYYNYIIDREGSIMNTQINPRTFTDQIPAYYEKTKYLQSLGRQDLADIHDYFFYKRLLQFYYKLVTDSDEKPDFVRQLRCILFRDKERVLEVYDCRMATDRERKEVRLFFKSPRKYCRQMQFKLKKWIPFKARVKAVLKR